MVLEVQNPSDHVIQIRLVTEVFDLFQLLATKLMQLHSKVKAELDDLPHPCVSAALASACIAHPSSAECKTLPAGIYSNPIYTFPLIFILGIMLTYYIRT